MAKRTRQKIYLAVQVHDELRGYDETLAVAQDTPDQDLEAAIVDLRKQLTAGFFDHVGNLIQAAHKDVKHREGEPAIAAWTYAVFQSTITRAAVHTQTCS